MYGGQLPHVEVSPDVRKSASERMREVDVKGFPPGFRYPNDINSVNQVDPLKKSSNLQGREKGGCEGYCSSLYMMCLRRDTWGVAHHLEGLPRYSYCKRFASSYSCATARPLLMRHVVFSHAHTPPIRANVY
jgi:hypothetical protein